MQTSARESGMKSAQFNSPTGREERTFKEAEETVQNAEEIVKKWNHSNE